LIFDDHVRPPILLSSAFASYADLFSVACREADILFTHYDSVYGTAISFILLMIGVPAIIDHREGIDSSLIIETEQNNIQIYKGYTIVDTFRYNRINYVSIMKLSKDGQKVIGSKENISCDSLGISGGWTPPVHLFTQSGGKLKFRDDHQVFIPNTYPSIQISFGSCNGDFTLKEILINPPPPTQRIFKYPTNRIPQSRKILST
jgi:hypothetical protein